GKCDQVHGAVILGEPQHPLESDAVVFREKVVLADHLERDIERAVIEENGPEHRAFGLQALRKTANAFEGGRHGRQFQLISCSKIITVSVGGRRPVVSSEFLSSESGCCKRRTRNPELLRRARLAGLRFVGGWGGRRGLAFG